MSADKRVRVGHPGLRGEGRDEGTPRFSGRAIQREVLAEALQHPATLYPFAVFALAATYGAFAAPFLGGQPWAMLVALCSGVGSAASFTWRYLVRGEGSAREKARQLIALEERQRRESHEQELSELVSHLESGFGQLRFPQGVKALHQLTNEYAQLQEALEYHRYAVFSPRVARSAMESYREGLSALAAAEELVRVIQATDRRDLEAEIQELRSQVRVLEREGGRSERVSLNRETIEAHQRTLGLLEGQGLEVERLLHQADLLEAELRGVRVGLPSLEALGSDQSLAPAAVKAPKTRGAAEVPDEEERTRG